jgi:ubiquinone biosynthesis protein UbiJ
MRVPAGLLLTLESALNRYLRLDPEALRRISQLDGRCIGLDLRGTGIRFYLLPMAGGVRLLEQAEQVDTMLHGTPLSMLRLGLGSNGKKALFSGDVVITGDVETGQAFKSILDDMDIDWEEQLAAITGDVFAHQAGNAFRHAGRLMRNGGQTLEQDLAEYLKEELRVLPCRIEIENLGAEISNTRSATDRLEARIRRLLSDTGQ